MSLRPIIFALVAACGARQLPPPSVPARELPGGFEPGSPEAGQGRVILDAVGEPATVSEVNRVGLAVSVIGAADVSAIRDLCITPCAVDFKPGSHELILTSRIDHDRFGTGYVQVRTGETSAYRQKLGFKKSRTGERILGVFGTFAGTVATVTGLSSIANYPLEGVVVGAIGAGVLAGSVYLLFDSRSTEQLSADIQWNVGARAHVATYRHTF